MAGKSIYCAGGKYTELEDSIDQSKPIWLGEENAYWHSEGVRRNPFGANAN